MVLPDRVSRKLTEMLRSKSLHGWLKAIHLSTPATTVCNGEIVPCLERQVPPSLKSHHEKVLARSFVCSPIMPDHVLGEEFDAESGQHARSPCEHEISVRTLPRRAGIWDDEFPWRHHSRSIMDEFQMRWRGAGLYPGKLLNCRSLTTLDLHDVGKQPESPCSMQILKARLHKVQKPMKKVDERSHASDAESNKTEKAVAEEESNPSMVAEESVQTLEALLKELEASAPAGDPRIGVTCLRLAQLCVSLDEDSEKILMYGQRALKILGSPEVSLECATCLEVIGCAYHKKGEFEKAVAQLERAAMVLEKLRETVKEQEMGTLQHAVQALLGQANMSLGRQDEALLNFQEAIAINERVLKPHDPDLGRSYQQAAKAYMQAQDLEEALSLCMKALPIYTEYYGSGSSQVAEIRKLLSVIYYDLDEFEKVLSEHQLIRPILESLGNSEEVASLDLASGEAFLCLERYVEAIPKLKHVVKQTTSASRFHGQALVLLAKAYAALKKDKDATKYCHEALDILRNKRLSLEAGAGLVELALVFRQLNENGQALSILKMTLETYQQYREEQVAIAYIEGQIGLLFLTLEKASEALPYLERCAAKNESIHGLESDELFDVYNHLGAAYIQLGKLDEALAKLEVAKTIATQSNASENPDTITLYNNLANVYTALGRFAEAILCLKLLINSIKKTGIQTVVRLEEAQKKLKELLQEAKSEENTKGTQSSEDNQSTSM